ncbi:2-oxoacid:acceptor oxidoreductase subunit alpha [candidate division KSB1 bacterium]
MKTDPKGVLTGIHFLDGDHACCEGALSAGCRFVAGYPITPSTEVVERIAARFPLVGGCFIQMEDEIASSIAILGGAWAGKKVMTVTSGPGLSLMMEHVGLAAMSETPCVFVDVQRGGPSTGLPTLPAQQDIMQARWGSHGDYEVIALSPNSCQESYDLTIKAFNLAEEYRVPVFFMLDECVGHMTEKVVIPEPDKIEITPRKFTKKKPGDYLLFETDDSLVPEMVKAGDGYNVHVTGLTHDERGYPVLTPETQDKLVRRLVNKIRNNADKIAMYEEIMMDDAEIVVLAFGITSRVSMKAIETAREKGIKVGMLRLQVIWPFPETKIRELTKNIKGFVVPEMNLGQLVLEVERVVAEKTKVVSVTNAGGEVHNPEDIYDAIVGINK